MFSFTTLSAVALFAAGVSAQSTPLDPSIQTPQAVTECETTAISWFATHLPVVISAIPGGQVGGTPLETIVTTSVSPYPWLVNLGEGTYFTLQIRDNIGGLQYSGPTTVIGSSNTTCVGQGNGATVTSSGAAPTAPAPGTSSTPVSAPGTTSTGGATTPTSPSSAPGTTSTPASKSAAPTSASGTSAAPSTTPTKSGAFKLDAKSGAVGFVAVLAAAALFA